MCTSYELERHSTNVVTKFSVQMRFSRDSIGTAPLIGVAEQLYYVESESTCCATSSSNSRGVRLSLSEL